MKITPGLLERIGFARAENGEYVLCRSKTRVVLTPDPSPLARGWRLGHMWPADVAGLVVMLVMLGAGRGKDASADHVLDGLGAARAREWPEAKGWEGCRAQHPGLTTARPAP